MATPVRIVPPTLRRRNEFLAGAERSASLHAPWVTPPRTKKAFAAYLKQVRRPDHLGWWVATPKDELAGAITVSGIVRGNFQSGYLGYYAFAPHDGNGYMKTGLGLAIGEAFGRHSLHRLEANIQPGNRTSRRLIARLGFRREGFSPRYLAVGGMWCDHERWALTAEDWPPSSSDSASR